MITHEEMRAKIVDAIFGEHEVMYGVGYLEVVEFYELVIFDSYTSDFEEAKSRCEALNGDKEPSYFGSYSVYQIEKKRMLEINDYHMLHPRAVKEIGGFFSKVASREIKDYRSKEDQRFQDKYEEEWTSL